MYTIEKDGYKNTNHYGLWEVELDASGQIEWEDHLSYFMNNYVTNFSYNFLKNLQPTNIEAFIDYYESDCSLYLDYDQGVYNKNAIFVKPVSTDKIK